MSAETEALQKCISRWIPEGKDPSWYAGFLQCLEIYGGVQHLFRQELSPIAHALMEQKCQAQLIRKPHDAL